MCQGKNTTPERYQTLRTTTSTPTTLPYENLPGLRIAQTVT